MSFRKPFHLPVVVGIMAAIFVWGLLIAIGTFRFNWGQQETVKLIAIPMIVLVTIGVFLASWYGAWVGRERSAGRSESNQANSPRNRTCIASAWIGVPAAVILIASRFGRFSLPAAINVMITAVSLMLLFASLVVAIIGLSNPNYPRGKWAALVVLVLAVVILVGSFVGY